MIVKNQTFEVPSIGMGATIYYVSDRKAVTIIDVSESGKKITLQEDKATRLDKNGMSEIQEYSYQKDSNGQIFEASLRKDGIFKLVKGSQKVVLGERRKYYDFSF